MDIYQQLEKVKTKKELIAFIKALRNDFKSNKDSWQNWTLEAYLESMEAWLNDGDGLLMNTGKKIEELSKWELVATILYAGKIYE